MEDQKTVLAPDRIASALIAARDLVVQGEVLEGCELSLMGVGLYVGRYFGQINFHEAAELEEGSSGKTVPTLPYIVTFQVGNMPARNRPRLSVICVVAVGEILSEPPRDAMEMRHLMTNYRRGTRPNSKGAMEMWRMERRMAESGIALDLYMFSELFYAIFSLPVDADPALMD